MTIKQHTDYIINLIKLSEKGAVKIILEGPGVRETLMGNKPGAEWKDLDLFLLKRYGAGPEGQALLNRKARGCEQKLLQLQKQEKFEKQKKEEEEKLVVQNLLSSIQEMDDNLLIKKEIHKKLVFESQKLLTEIQEMTIVRENLFNSLPTKEKLFSVKK